jgi:DNA/RNA-binding domain of Phe-tRNA-synthetase-like protein
VGGSWGEHSHRLEHERRNTLLDLPPGGPTMLTIDPHPLLDLRAFTTRWPAPLGSMSSPAWLHALADLEAEQPFSPFDDEIKKAVRDLLRHGGFKPAGRSKPCNEYIRGVAIKGAFPMINPAVDATNLAALHGCLPVSTVDPDKLTPPLRVGIAQPGARYVFNASGQDIDLSGLLCLFDGTGPCANSVKDSQRAKTDDGSTRTLTVIWGTTALSGRAQALLDWHVQLNLRLGGEVEVLP